MTRAMQALKEGWDAFDRLDCNDETHVKSFRIIEHEPDLFCWVEYTFDSGTGVELTWTDLATEDEEEKFLSQLPPARYLSGQRWGVSEGGFAQTKVRGWRSN